MRWILSNISNHFLQSKTTSDKIKQATIELIKIYLTLGNYFVNKVWVPDMKKWKDIPCNAPRTTEEITIEHEEKLLRAKSIPSE